VARPLKLQADHTNRVGLETGRGEHGRMIKKGIV
jgi:hypothetical protein